MKLKGKVAVVTGASSGMGRSIALLFAKEGAQVIAAARRAERLEELAKEAEGYEGKIIPFRCDVSKKEDNELMIDTAIKEFGRIDILVNNAGIMDEMMPVAEVTDELWHKIIDVNLSGPFYSCRKAVNVMLSQGHGNIINVASIGGLNGGRAGASYTASKFGLVGMTKNIGYMYASQGIRCNVICPGGVASEIGVGITNPSPLGIKMAQAGGANMARMGTPDEIASIALFLASDDSSFINGAEIVADSGWTAY
ncbi:glucose 1-dehydrogenase [Anaeropeptidivorans aminofermentans]|jgi:NAD(P)-dependent dehydrogenase (short-subunit alcohol dehydrogenase family)|uniref:glucose 1-dehydrogenase n=1 Tax=Anaeropeptidivorans aminofermentans TaxID=2934315 RepID=UPI00202472C8|nr:glucose 1-dehydrogenase [Anaeropeptidivorans aminofermentans]MBE6011965.1 glucose 1-dehydrogenase [Lachnospiraceae bacterium]